MQANRECVCVREKRVLWSQVRVLRTENRLTKPNQTTSLFLFLGLSGLMMRCILLTLSREQKVRGIGLEWRLRVEIEEDEDEDEELEVWNWS